MYIEPLLYSQSKAAHSTIVYLLYTIYTIYILYILYTILYTISAALCGNMVANGYKQKLNTYICCLIIFLYFQVSAMRISTNVMMELAAILR